MHDWRRHLHLAGWGRVDESQQQAAAAAAAITALLSQIGLCKVLFVLTEKSGRLRPADKALMKLVLASAHIEDFGVIINKVSKGFMEMIETGNKADNRELDPMESFMAQVRSTGHFTDLVAVNPFNAELTLSRPAGGADNPDSPAMPLTKELSHFIDSVPATDVRLGAADGDDVQQGMMSSLEEKLTELLKLQKNKKDDVQQRKVPRAPDNYELLEVPAGSSREEIKRAYWAQVDKAHPDKELRRLRLTRARNDLLAALPKVDPPTKYLFLCYDGVSRPRAILSALIREEEAVEQSLFGPGPASLVHYEYKYDGDTYMALPGLADSFSREQVIEGMNRLLRQGGHFKVTFVLGGDGGLSHGDATLIKLVIDSLDYSHSLSHCGILCSGDCQDKMVTMQGLDNAGFFFFSDLVAYGFGRDPRCLQAKGLHDFLETFPTMDIKEGAAREIQLEDFTKQYSAFRDGATRRNVFTAWPVGRMLQ